MSRTTISQGKAMIEYEFLGVLPKPCPFCESDDIRINMPHLGHYRAYCSCCFAEGPGTKLPRTKFGALKRWSSRSKTKEG